jgi:hypothetical protein
MSNILPVPTPKDIALFFGERDGKVIETATLASGNIQNKTLDSTNTLSGVSLTATSSALTTPVVNSVVQGVATGSLTAAQVIAATTPHTLVAAPGSGKINIVKSIEFFLDYAAAFTSGSDYAVEYETSGTDIAAFDVASLTGTADISLFAVPSGYATTAGTSGTFVASANVNKAIKLLVTGTAFADGTGSVLKYKIHYETHTLLT